MSGAPVATPKRRCARVVLMAAVVVVTSDPSTAAFVQDIATYRFYSGNYPHTLSTLHSFSSGGSANRWGEVAQNVIGSLDKRQKIKDDIEKKRRNNNNVNGENSNSNIKFVSPLLEDGYPPVVMEYEEQTNYKPILLYLPGFDGTILAPFLQFPSLGEEFDVRAMKVDMDDRSTFEELKEAVVEYLMRECRGGSNDGPGVLYLMGESFGGILATEVALELNRQAYDDFIELRGLILVNPATSYLRSRLYEIGPPIANASDFLYVFSLAIRIVPLFLDKGRAMKQLIAILTSKGLPAVVNNPQREAYMGRVAFDLPNRLKFMPKVSSPQLNSLFVTLWLLLQS